MFKSTPAYSNLKPFGCCCYPWLRPYVSHKLVPRSTPCIFLGYCDYTKGHRCYDPITTKVYTSRHVKFVENSFPFPNLITDSTSITQVSTSFNVPLTSFSDIVIPVPSSTLPTYPSQSIVPSGHSSLNSESITINVPVPLSKDHSVPSNPTPISDLRHTNLTPTSDLSSLVPPQSILVSSSTHGNTHPMLTRSKHGISKPKPIVSLNAISTSSVPTIL